MASGVANLGGYNSSIRGDTSQLRGDLGRARNMFKSGMAEIAKISTGIIAAAGFGRLIDGVKQLASTMIDSNATMESYTTSFAVMLDSAARARALIGDIEKMAATTPFSTGSLVKATQQLKAYGFETKRLLPMLRIIGDAAAASPEGMEGSVQIISRTLGQMRTAGRVAANDMNSLTSVGISAWEMLATAAGKSVAQIKKDAESGALDSGAAIEAIMSGMQQQFGGMMDARSRTWTGMLSTLKDNVGIAMRGIGKEVFDAAEGALGSMLAWMDSPEFKAAVDNVKGMIHSVMETLRALSASPLAMAIAKFAGLSAAALLAGGALALVLSPLIAIASAGAAVLAALAPLIAAAAAVGAALYTAFNSPYGEELRATLTEIYNSVSAVITNLTETFAGFFSYISTAFREVFSAVTPYIGQAFAYIAEKIRDVMHWVAVMSNNWGLVWKWMYTTTAVQLVAVLNQTVWLFKEITAVAWGGMAAVWTAVKETVLNIGTIFKNVITMIAGLFKGLWEGIKSKLSGGDFMEPFMKKFEEELAKLEDTGIAKKTRESFDAARGNLRKKLGANETLDATEGILRGDKARIEGQMQAGFEGKQTGRGMSALFDSTKGLLSSLASAGMGVLKSDFEVAKNIGEQLWGGLKDELAAKDAEQAPEKKKEKEQERKTQFVGLSDLSKRIQENLTKKEKADKHADRNAENLKRIADHQEKAAGFMANLEKKLPWAARASG